MGFSLGGLVKTALKGVIHLGPLAPIGAAYDAVKTANAIIKPRAPVSGSSPGVLGRLPAIFTGEAPVTGGVMPGGSGGAPGLPSLPAIPGTAIVRSSDVRGAVPTAYGTTAHAGQMGHYSRTGRFIRTTRTGKAIRRMNPANGHAIRRAARRIKAAEKMFRKVLSITHPGVKGHIRPKFGKRKRA